MKRLQKDEIPLSKISHTDVIQDFSGLNGEEKILYLNPKCVLVGLNDVPHTLFVTADFDRMDIIKTIGEDLYDIKRLILKPTFSYVSPENRKYCKIPDWFLAFKKTELLKFEYVELDELWLFRELPVQHLILQNVKFDDPAIFTNSIFQFDALQEISYDDSFDETLLGKVISAKPHIKLTYVIE